LTDPMSTTPVLERTIAAVLDKQVAALPDKTALLEAATGATVTYTQLQERAFRLSAGLSGMGVTRQQPVLVMLDNHIDMVVTWAGIGVGAMIEVPINTAYKGEMLRYIMDHSGATIAIVEARYCERISEILDGVPELRTIVVRGEGGAVSDYTLPDRIVRRDFAELSATIGGPAPVRPSPTSPRSSTPQAPRAAPKVCSARTGTHSRPRRRTPTRPTSPTSCW
jgi:crotonobetaine/carnitine-CoA ligase